MATFPERLSLLAKKEGITIGALEKKIGASKGVLSRAIQNNTDISSEWINKVVELYPQHSSWLITGNEEINSISSNKFNWFVSSVQALNEVGISKAEIARRLKIKPQQLNNILNRRKSVSDKFLDKFWVEFSHLPESKSPSNDRLCRLNEAIFYLTSERKIYNQSDLAEILGKQRSWISELLSGKREVSDSFIESFTSKFPCISKEWLFSGDSEMLCSDCEMFPELNRDELIKLYKAQLDEKDSQIKQLLEIISNLTKEKL